MSYRIVLLDLDHTLFDTDRSLALAFDDAMAVAGAEGAPLYPVFDGINKALWDQVEQQELTPPEVHIARFEQLVEQLSLDASPAEMADAFAAGMGEHGDLYDGARTVLDELVQAATLGLITNGLSAIQRRRLERLSLDEYFSAVVISAEVGLAKPAPEIFDLAFSQLNTTADDATRATTLMVGDSLTSDIAGGIAARVDTCWYNPHDKPADPQVPLTHTIASLAELPRIVSHGG